MISADGYLMPIQTGQQPLDMKYYSARPALRGHAAGGARSKCIHCAGETYPCEPSPALEVKALVACAKPATDGATDDAPPPRIKSALVSVSACFSRMAK